VLDLLKSGGAERLNYFSDYVTHLICGDNPEETDITDANDLYEIPAVSSNWVFMCVKLKRVVNTKPYLYNLQKLFSNLTFCLSKAGSDRNALWALITYHGGLVQLNLDRNCTHLVTTDVTTAKYEKAFNLGSEKITIVTPDWLVESVQNKSLAQVDLFHPKLIQWPKVIRHESTISITGFEPEKVEPVEKSNDSLVTDSTQALLDKLKQRMPWIQPQATSVADIVPPNVVAPSFLNKNQQGQAIRTFNQPQVAQQQQPQPVSTTFVQQQQQQPPNIVSKSADSKEYRSSHSSTTAVDAAATTTTTDAVATTTAVAHI
jgi:PAX-interacting protein 1